MDRTRAGSRAQMAEIRSANTTRSSRAAATGAGSLERDLARRSRSPLGGADRSSSASSSSKFFGIFISVGGYALIWGWTFALGFVLMIFVHELGHFFEARRQGLQRVVADVHPVLRRVRDDRATRG